jgi:hypothetical protein
MGTAEAVVMDEPRIQRGLDRVADMTTEQVCAELGRTVRVPLIVDDFNPRLAAKIAGKTLTVRQLAENFREAADEFKRNGTNRNVRILFARHPDMLRTLTTPAELHELSRWLGN